MTERKEIFLSFYEWIIKFEDIDHRFGDLAKDAKADPNFPKRSTSHSEIKEYLQRKTVSKDLFETLEMAFFVFNDDMSGQNPDEDLHPISLTEDEIEEVSEALKTHKKGKSDEEIREINGVLKKIRAPLQE